MQTLVKEGHGLTLIREGTILDDELTTRPISGVDWTVDTAVIYHKLRHPKTVPILVRKFGRQSPQNAKESKPARYPFSSTSEASSSTGNGRSGAIDLLPGSS